MKVFIHNLLGFDLSKFRWYRMWQGGEWTLVYIKAVDYYLWVKDYKGVSQAKTIMKESW